MNAESPPARRLTAFIALGAAQLIAYLAMASALPHGDGLLRIILPLLLAFGLYLLALRTAGPLSGPAAFTAAAVFALLFRAVLFPEPPYLSDDVYRYLWDGQVQLRGLNPYRHAPADPAVAGLDNALRARVNHPGVPTIYPPLAQLAFLAAAALPGGPLAVKLFWLLADLAIALLLPALLPAERRLQGWTLYAWSPLVVVEVAGSGHLDALGVLPLVAALWLAARHGGRRGIAVGIALAAATGVKYFAATLVPAAARRLGARWVLAGFAAALALLYIPYLNAGPALFAGLTTFAVHWRFNDGLYWILEAALGGYGARAVGAGIVLFLIVQSVRNAWSLERAAFWLTGAILLLSPTVHPWYLIWMVPLVAIRPSRGWLYLTGSVLLAYYGLEPYREQGVWPQPLWLRALIYSPGLALLAYDGWRGSWLEAAVGVLGRGRPSGRPGGPGEAPAGREDT